MDPREVETHVERIEDGVLRRVLLVPDALALVETDSGSEVLAIEVDRGTERPSYMARKYGAYLDWWRSGRHLDDWKSSAVRILTIAPSERRSQRLARACREATGGKVSGLFWFASEPDIVRGGILTPVWSTTTEAQKSLWPHATSSSR